MRLSKGAGGFQAMEKVILLLPIKLLICKCFSCFLLGKFFYSIIFEDTSLPSESLPLCAENNHATAKHGLRWNFLKV